MEILEEMTLTIERNKGNERMSIKNVCEKWKKEQWNVKGKNRVMKKKGFNGSKFFDLQVLELRNFLGT